MCFTNSVEALLGLPNNVINPWPHLRLVLVPMLRALPSTSYIGELNTPERVAVNSRAQLGKQSIR